MYRKYIKRLIDIIFSLIALPFLLFIFIIIAPIIFLYDRGPVFYNAKRIGRDGKLFKMYKFRSMRVDSPDIRLADGSTFNGEDDPRVTRIGKFMRKTSIDEVPQILNILRGDMSLIGPRPDPPDWLMRYPADIKEFLSVRPGITGYNQAYYRNEADGNEKMINDLFYAQNCSFPLDIKIFFMTILIILLQKNTFKNIEKEKRNFSKLESIDTCGKEDLNGK